jgi:hypothetical protein
MTKDTLFYIANQLKPLIAKQDTSYKKLIPMEIRVVCAIYKLAQGVNFFICFELFAMGNQ